MKITIVTDGNNKLGMGHIYQSMALASLLSKTTNDEVEILFITKSDKNVIELIEKKGYTVYQFSNDELIFKALENEKPDRIIFDKLDVASDLAKKIKNELKIKLIIFTNLTKANKYANITVLARIGTNYIIKKRKQIEYVGPKYWILRPEFYLVKEKLKVYKDEVIDIMLIFGGSDPRNFSSLVLDELLKIDTKFKIQLVLGSGFIHNEELNSVLIKNKFSKSNINIVKKINNVGETMFNSDLVITSPGLSFFEALVVGTPVIVFHQNEGHVKEFGHILPTMDITDLYKLPSIIKDKLFFFPDNPIISRMKIGEGKDEILMDILN